MDALDSDSLVGLLRVVYIVGHVGANSAACRALCEWLSPLFQDPSSFFVISSDFCHWGKRFGYTNYDKQIGAVWQFIQALDKSGMKAILSEDPTRFATYLKETKNTICGRHPIAMLLGAMQLYKAAEPLRIEFVKYAQSSRCSHPSKDSSVSYAAGVVFSGALDFAASAAAVDSLPLSVVSEINLDDSD